MSEVSRVAFAIGQQEDRSWIVSVGVAAIGDEDLSWTEMPTMPDYDAALAAVGMLARMLRSGVATKLSGRMDMAAEIVGEIARREAHG